MNITINQIIYALVFVSIVLIVEAIYYFLRGSDHQELAANRRMQVVQKSDTGVLNPSIMRKEVIGGAFSRGLFKIAPNLERMFLVANLRITPGALVGLSILLVAVVFYFLRFVVTVPVGMAFGASLIIGLGLPFLVLNIIVSIQRGKFSEQLPNAINLISRGLQAGHPVPVAFELVAKEMPDPLGGEFGNVIDEINFGRDRNKSLRDVAKKFPDPDFKFFLAAVEMQRETGGNLVEILDNLSRIIRERSNMKKKAMAVSAEGRLTLLIVGSLPYILLGFLMSSNPSFILDVVDHPVFWPMMGGAWILWLIGVIWIWRMVDIKV